MREILDQVLRLKRSGVENVADMRRLMEEAKQEVAKASPEDRAHAEFIRTPPISPIQFVLGLGAVTVLGAVPMVAGYFVLGRRPDAQIFTASVVIMTLIGLLAFGYFKRAAKWSPNWDDRFVLRMFVLIFIVYGQLMAGLIAWIFF